MPPTTVDLGSVTVRQKSSSFALTLSSSCIIEDLPFIWGELPDASEIARASREGALWIAKAGSCQLDFTTTINGSLLVDTAADPAVLSEIICMVAECPIWNDIELPLRDIYASNIARETEQNNARASYFLHHPDLSSDIYAPPAVSCARFQGLKCQIDVRFDVFSQRSRKRKRRSSGQTPSHPLRHTTRRNPTGSPRNSHPGIQDIGSNSSPGENKTPKTTLDVPGPAHNHGYHLQRSPRPTSNALGELDDVEDLDAGNFSRMPAFPEQTGGGGEEEGGDAGPTVSEVMIADVAETGPLLLDVALRVLVGVRKRVQGINITRDSLLPTLIDVAPAVWNLRYLQLVAAHARAIPDIAGGITRLRNARSPRLRQKVDMITGRGTDGNISRADGSQQSDITDMITQRLWSLLLSSQNGIKASPIPKGRAKMEPTSQVIPYEPATVQGRDDYQKVQSILLPYWEPPTNHYTIPSIAVSYPYGQFRLENRELEEGKEMGIDMDEDDLSEIWQAEIMEPGYQSEGEYGSEEGEEEEQLLLQDDESDHDDGWEAVGYLHQDEYGSYIPLGEEVDEGHYDSSEPGLYTGQLLTEELLFQGWEVDEYEDGDGAVDVDVEYHLHWQNFLEARY